MKRLTISGLFIISTTLLLLDSLTRLDITSSIVILITRLLSYSTFAIILIGFLLKQKGNKLVLYTGLTVGFLFILSFPYYKWNLEWKTQTILYQNLHLANRTIEFQTQDMGALGSSSRTVDRVKILPCIDWTKIINTENIDTLTWKKVDIDKD